MRAITLMIACFYAQGINLNEAVDGRPLIHYAADYGQVHVIEYLVGKGANVNVSGIWLITFFLFYILIILNTRFI